MVVRESAGRQSSRLARLAGALIAPWLMGGTLADDDGIDSTIEIEQDDEYSLTFEVARAGPTDSVAIELEFPLSEAFVAELSLELGREAAIDERIDGHEAVASVEWQAIELDSGFSVALAVETSRQYERTSTRRSGETPGGVVEDDDDEADDDEDDAGNTERSRESVYRMALTQSLFERLELGVAFEHERVHATGPDRSMNIVSAGIAIAWLDSLESAIEAERRRESAAETAWTFALTFDATERWSIGIEHERERGEPDETRLNIALQL